MNNPYLDELMKIYPLEWWLSSSHGKWKYVRKHDLSILDSLMRIKDRFAFTAKYAWAIPIEEAVRKIASYGKLIEIGAGTGYWAWCLRQIGADIIAYDKASYQNHWYANHKWSEVLVGGPEKLKEHQDRTLFLCWPPYKDTLVTECLDNYSGNTLIYIGENDGCTGWDERLDKEWKEIDVIKIPQFDGIHDYLGIWRNDKLNS